MGRAIPQNLTVLSYNIWEGGGDRLDLLEQVMRTSQADVIGVQEANSLTNLLELARRLSMQCFIATGNSDYHVALLSRWPIRSARDVRSDVLWHGLLEAEVADGVGHTMQLFVTHLRPGGDQVANRRHELQFIREELVRSARARCLVMGDFNTLYPGDPFHGSDKYPDVMAQWREVQRESCLSVLLDAGLQDTFHLVNDDPHTFSYDRYGFAMRMDQVWVPPSVAQAVRSCRILDDSTVSQASDHRPVCVTLDWESLVDRRAQTPHP